jgi:hypothetical protein
MADLMLQQEPDVVNEIWFLIFTQVQNFTVSLLV